MGGKYQIVFLIFTPSPLIDPPYMTPKGGEDRDGGVIRAAKGVFETQHFFLLFSSRITLVLCKTPHFFHCEGFEKVDATGYISAFFVSHIHF